MVYIAVGSNLGDKRANCDRGVAELVAVSGSRLLSRSKVYRTEPVGERDQGWFVNYAVALETSRGPLELLADIGRVERGAGRVRGPRRFGPRVLDLDIVLFGTRVIELPQLKVPHPRMHERHFVLRPLCDIDPGIVHPVLNKPIRRLLAELDTTDQQVIEMP